jgi:hypothetical protein
VFLSVDADLAMLANLTHIRSKGVMHRNQTFEGGGVAVSLSHPTSTPTVT